MRQVLRLTLIAALAAVSVGMVVHSVRGVKFQVGDYQLSELEVNQYMFAEQIVNDGKGNLNFTSALPDSGIKAYAQVASADPAVAISALESTLITATAKKPAAVKPGAKAPANKPAAKAPVTKAPAKAPAKKPAPKPAPGKACPT